MSFRSMLIFLVACLHFFTAHYSVSLSEHAEHRQVLNIRRWGVAVEWKGFAWSNKKGSVQYYSRVPVSTTSGNSCVQTNWV